MQRRSFIKQSIFITVGSTIASDLFLFANNTDAPQVKKTLRNAFESFRNPASRYRPFVRWWWNGDKVEAKELVRELHLLKDAGIGGVEINPIAFPTTGDDLGKKSLYWLSDEWIEMLQVVFDEAKRLDMTCDLIVGSGWPFGSESLERNERAQVMILYAEPVEGKTVFETSQFNIFKEIDPGVTVPNPSRTCSLVSLKLVPDPMSSLDQVVDLSSQCKDEVIRVDIPEGKYVFYALVKFDSFASVINGAPGAAGPILNHMDEKAVYKYLKHMSGTIEQKTGPLSRYLRAFFTDSMELEGCNWTTDLAEEFRKRRGYDLMPWLPFTMFKVGRLGAVVDDKYGAAKTPEFEEEVKRVRFDFELTKAELLYERFTQTYLRWCRELNVKSRAQAYGRGFFPLESSLGYDIPEGESWTTNWLKHRLGEEMGDEDYRRGRGYTMINKYVSSAAHLTGKRVVSAEEMTNTYIVFNETLELLKIGSDMSAISGTTHSVWHGFNYSPPEAPFPGWVQYGSYYNENSTWWPYFKYLNDYRARLASQLQQADMCTDIALLPANYDMWGEMGVQTDPFPEKLNIPYTSLIWEAIHKNGGGADYVTEIILKEATVEKGKLCYGKKKYGTLFLIEVTSTYPGTLDKLYDFVSTGGRIFCIGKFPDKSLGLKDYRQRDQEIREKVSRLKLFTDRFVLLEKPVDNKYLEWYTEVMAKYSIPHYVTVSKPDRFLLQNCYQTDDKNHFFLFVNAHMHEERQTELTFPGELTKGRHGWIWDPVTGDKYRINLKNGRFLLDLGPAQTLLIVFNKEGKGRDWNPLPRSGKNSLSVDHWDVELQHGRENRTETIHMDTLKDLKDTEYVNFMGKAIYRTKIQVKDTNRKILNLGKVWGLNELFVNGKSCGVKWFGYRIYDLTDFLIKGENEIEVHVITTMGNYMKTLKDNQTAQKFTILKSKDQPIQSMGLIGPVAIY